MNSPVIVALDFDNRDAALSLAEQLDPGRCGLKVGKELFTRCGPELVREFVAGGFRVFLDLKFHDIPNTTARAVAAAADLGVWMVNVHASGGTRMMEAAARQLRSMGSETLLTAVTVLTSMAQDDLEEIGIPGKMAAQVERLARLARASGLDGVVCSGHEAGAIRDSCGEQFLRVSPGIRPASAVANDQARIMSPAAALGAGSTHLVIGRPITASASPRDAVLEILGEIGNL